MVIPANPEPSSPSGANDWWYGRGEFPYPIARQARPQITLQAGIVSSLSIVVGVNVTHTFTSVNGATAQTSPDSTISLTLTSTALVYYLGSFWYDVANPAANAAATLYRGVAVDGAVQQVSFGLLYNVPNGKVLETVPNHELFYVKVWEFLLLDPGVHQVSHIAYVNNAATALTVGNNFSLVYSDRTWLAYAFPAVRV